MLKTLLMLVLISGLLLPYGKTYMTQKENEITIGNQYLERVIRISPENPGTVRLINKLSGRTYEVESKEYEMAIVFAGFGPAYGKEQNGENPSLMTIKDFQLTGVNKGNLNSEVKRLSMSFKYDSYLTALRITVNYEVGPDDFYIRKWIDIVDSSEGIHFLTKLQVEALKFANPSFSHGEFGQPVFSDDMFFGVEYPASENIISDRELKCGYTAGLKMTGNIYRSFNSVIGAAVSPEKLELAFMDYVDRIKVKGTRPYLLYNSWYDFRNPAVTKEKDAMMTEQNVLHRIDTFRKYMYEKFDISLDAFVLDDGWDNYNGIWEIDTTTLPNKFTPFLAPLKEMNTSLGIWASPFCGYDMRPARVKWGAEHGYERVGEFLCFAGQKYKAEFKKKMVDYTRQYDLGYFKWDGFLLACNETDHGHLPGVYSREALIHTYSDMMASVREVNPDIFINITVGSWLSPWWLLYADCIWMQGEDYAYAEDVPSMNPRDKAITYRDAVLWGNFQKQKLLFPVSSLMTHGIIKGRLNFLGGKNESLASFTNEVMMYFGRGVMMWELYVSPDLLSDAEWQAIASSVKWVKANQNILSKTKMILGEPLKREPYGYVHLGSEKGIVLLRNPSIENKTVQVPLSADFGQMNPETDYYVKIVYPYNYILPASVRADGSFTLDLDGYEVVVAELIPSEQMDMSLPVAVRYNYSEKPGEVILYSENGGEKQYSLASKETAQISFPGKKDEIKYKDMGLSHASDKQNTVKIKTDVPEGYENTYVALLIEPVDKLQNENAPHFTVKVNGKNVTPQIEQENGKWFWVMVPVTNGSSNIEFNLALKNGLAGKMSSWIFADEVLSSGRIKTAVKSTENILPPKPYPANIKKVSLHIADYSKGGK